ncbi:hypothetical protein ACWPKO_05210 [Coraliomargarita sp. W4R53]
MNDSFRMVCFNDKSTKITHPPPVKKTMKVNTPTLCVVIAIFASSSASFAATDVFNLASAPTENVVISQTAFAGDTQTRVNNSQADYKGGSQTFLWNSTQALGSIGFRLSESQGMVDPFTESQQYRIYINEVTDVVPAVVTSLVGSFDFTIEAADVKAEEYIVFDFGIAGVNLTNGGRYGFTIVPAQMPDGGSSTRTQRLFFSTSANNTAYSDGVGAQPVFPSTPFPADTPSGGAYGSLGWDMTFVATAIPEPSSYAIIIGVMAMTVCGLRRRK